MATEKKYFSDLLDADTSPHAVSARAFINGLNLRFGSTDAGYLGLFENIKGNTERSNAALPGTGTNICIGACGDETDAYAIFFNFNSGGSHGIYLYNVLNSTMYVVAEQADITGGLNFDKYKLINGAFVFNGILYFNDGTTDGQRRLNLSAFMTAQGSSPVAADYSITLPINGFELSLIKKPCAFPPSSQKFFNSGVAANLIRNESFEFAYEYIYYDGEESVLSGWSKASLINKSIEDYNYITIAFSGEEPVPQTVRLINLICYNQSTNKAFKIKTWDRKISAENTQINILDLGFDFYGDILGTAVPDSDVVRPFHSVPLSSATMERIKNRIDLADNTEGYDTPTASSLTISLPSSIAGGFSSLSKPLISVKHRQTFAGVGSGLYAYSAWYVYLTEVVPAGYYEIVSTRSVVTGSSTYPSLPTAPTTVAFSGLAYYGTTEQDVIWGTKPGSGYIASEWIFTTTTNMCSITGIDSQTFGVMLPDSQHKVGIVFFDRYLRKCGVYFSAGVVSIPSRNFAAGAVYASIDWTLNNTSAATEIPDWAYYYAVVKTLNLSTRFFVASYDEAAKYAKKDISGTLVYTDTTYSSTNTIAIAIDSSALLAAGLGYTFNEGDECILIKSDNTIYRLPVIGQDGKYILIKPKDVGSTSGTHFVYRIYTPYKTSDQEPFFEMGDLYKVTNPTQSGRVYSTLSGSFRGDVFMLQRTYNGTNYIAEAMNPNDLYYTRWHTDAGRPNYITKLGQVRKKTGLSFSNVWIPGTQQNGLSAFEALNKEILPEEMGVIRKLISTSKVQQEGSVLLAIGTNETASIYIGESQVFDSKQSSFLLKSSGYIGDVNILKGNYGTQNPESVVEHQGQVAWWDVNKRSVVRYADNGLFPISDFGYMRAAALFCEKLETLSTGAIEALGSRPFIFGGVDIKHDEFLWTIPRTESTPPKGTLSDYSGPTINYPYDIYDGQAKTICYKIKLNKWAAPFGYEAEAFCNVGNHLFTFKAGKCYQNNTNSTYNNFFGVQQKTQIMFVMRGDDEMASKIKTFQSIAVEANVLPSFMHFRTEDPNVQSSDLVNTDDGWKTREGIFYTAILRDRLSPNATGTAIEKMFSGDKMRGPWMYVMAEWDTTSLLKLKYIDDSVNVTAGHPIV